MLFEEKIIFPAPRYPQGNWKPLGFTYEDVVFSAIDETQLHGWYFGLPNPRGYLLYCHGNGDCVGYLGEYAHDIRQRYDVAVFVFDYRGYGRSEGTPNEQGVMQDARAAQKWLADRAGKQADDLILMGRSLGGAVVVRLAAENGAKALVLQSTFTSMPAVAAAHYPWLPVRLLMRTKFDALEQIRKFDGPVLQCHGSVDEVIPLELGRQLFAAIPGPKKFFLCEGIGHNSPEPAAYDDLLLEFLVDVCK